MAKINLLKIIKFVFKWVAKKIYSLTLEKIYNRGWLRNEFQRENDSILRLCENFQLKGWDSSLKTQKYEILIKLKCNIEKFGNIKKENQSEIYGKIQNAIHNINKNKDINDMIEIKELIVCYLNKYWR